jgi:GNAT superfamily N-acetyltransferase
MQKLVTITSLEMLSREQLRPASREQALYHLMRAEVPCPELNRFLYASVGARWYWYMRLSWSYAQWREYVERPQLETWVAYVKGTPAGYFELERQPADVVELCYFGLLPQFIGKGLGAALLTDAIARAWDMGARRVWVHTCDLDHPLALANYEKRGFKRFNVEQKLEELPDEPVEPWPGANLRSA